MAQMTFPGPNDWCFDEMARHDDQRERERAARLETGIEPDTLTEQLSMSMIAGIKDGRARYGLDRSNANPRITIQIPVTPVLYDHFYNGRRGYRAHYWSAPDDGNDFDSRLVCLLRQAISSHMPAKIDGRKIDVRTDKGTRSDVDVGSCPISREFVLRSLAPEASKAWICERLITGKEGPLESQAFGVIGPRLIVEKWKACADGLRAPCGKWLDFKGGFVDDNGSMTPTKNRNHRAKHIHDSGWTY
jgi:hypothetical protein